MSLMVRGGPQLDAVLPSCVAALEGMPNALGLPGARSLIVLVVDGLGASALKARRGHARTMAGAFDKASVISTGVPTTTAAALTTLMTGELPGRHGVVGYSVVDPESDRIVNQLNGWGAGSVDPLTWQRVPTVFERGDVRGVAVGAKKYRSSGFTRATLRGAEYAVADDIEDRFDAAVEAIRVPGTLVYLYVSEVDSVAHSDGWESDRWTQALEDVDAALASALPALGRGDLLLVTADHGIVDVPGHRHVLIDEHHQLIDGVRHVAGEPRMLHLYLEPDLVPSHREALLERWRAAEGSRAWVRSREEAIAEGWFGAVEEEVEPRIGDILVAARGSVAYYDTRTATVGSRAMIGQHGSWTPEETRVPLLRFLGGHSAG